LAVTVAALAISAAARLAGAQHATEASPEKGYDLAQKFCQGCHLIESGAGTNSTTSVGVPTFRFIANRPGQTGEHITNVLIQPHAAMPDIRLTREEILNLLSYLETLRTDPQIAPLLTPAKPGLKPAYPSPS
jgi:mono/diheme cytochrome c family protein